MQYTDAKHLSKQQAKETAEQAEQKAEWLAIMKQAMRKQSFTPSEIELILQEELRTLNQLSIQEYALNHGPVKKAMEMMEHFEGRK